MATPAASARARRRAQPASEAPPTVVRALDTRVATTGPATALRVHELVSLEGNRWSSPGEPTIYLASSEGVAIAEFGRHFDESMGPMGLWTVRLRLDALADVRGLRERERTRLLERRECRDLARSFRARPDCRGLLVPSVAFLDRADCWNVVLFVERLRGPLDDVLTQERRSGIWSPTSPGPG